MFLVHGVGVLEVTGRGVGVGSLFPGGAARWGGRSAAVDSLTGMMEMERQTFLVGR